MLEIRPATSDEDLGHLARIASIVSPDNPTSLDEIRWAQRAYPGGRQFLAWLDGVPVGGGDVGRVYMHPPEYPALWANLNVLPAHRRRGAGTALLIAVSAVARDAGKTLLLGKTTSDKPDAIEFLEHRGFAEYERMRVVRLELAGLAPPDVNAPEGIEISSLEARPDAVPGVYAVAAEAMPDVPGEGPEAPATLEEFRIRDIDRRGVPPGGFAIAIDRTTGQVVGYANLLLVPGNPALAWHSMTAVARDWRGRGIAGALKRATIRWAIEHGLDALETQNDVDNAPMRAVNRRLGYQPMPDEIGIRGPLYLPGSAVGGPVAGSVTVPAGAR